MYFPKGIYTSSLPCANFAHILLPWPHVSCRHAPDIGSYLGPARFSTILLVDPKSLSRD